LFSQLKPYLDKRIGLIHCQERALWHDFYKIAGRVDCIAEWNGELSVIDFKTSTKEREDNWNENYYIQASAYAEMYQERTSQEINQIVILVVTEDGTVQEFVKDKHKYLHLLDKELNLYYNTVETGK
jgi:genome maintenance exonuclease 1